jgi:hypothetical protein
VAVIDLRKIQRLLDDIGVNRNVDVYLRRHVGCDYSIGVGFLRQWCRYLVILHCLVFTVYISFYEYPWTKKDF